MDSIFFKVSDFIIAKPHFLSKVVIVVMLVCLFGMSMLSMETGDDTYIDPDSPDGIRLNHFTDTFSKETVIILVESDDVTSPTVLKYLDSIKEPLLNLQYVSEVSSVSDLVKSLNNGQVPTSSTEVSAIKSSLPESVLNRYLPSNMMTMMTITLDSGLDQNRENTAMDNIQSFIDSTNIPPGVSITMTGSAAFQKEMGEEIGSSMITLIMAALVLMVLVLIVLFNYVSYRFLPIIMVTCGLLLTFGVMGLSGIHVSMAVMSAFPILLGLGVDYAIQIHSRLDEESRIHPLPEAIKITVTKTGPAVMYAMIATAMGFAAMFTSPVPMMAGFGTVCIIGVVCCYITSLIGIPLFAVLISYKPPARGKSKLSMVIDNGLSKLSVWISHRCIPVLIVVIFIAIIGIQLDSEIPVNTDEKSFVPSDMPSKASLDKVTRSMGSTTTLPILIAGSDPLSLESIKWIKEFSDFELSTKTKVIGASSIVDYVLTYNNNTMPQTQSELDLVLEKIPEDVKSSYVYGKTEAVIQFSTTKLTTQQMDSLKGQVQGDLKFLPPPPGIIATISGSFDLFTNLIGSIINSKEFMTYMGFLFVVIVLIVVYRNIDAVSPIVPIIAIVGWNGVALTVFGIDYNPMTACLGSMTIGVGAEYTILVMERYLEEREVCSSVTEAIKESVRKIGSSIMVSGLATAFGFSALLASTFPIVSNFGITTVIAVLFSLTAAVAVMPAILSFIDLVIKKGKSIANST